MLRSFVSLSWDIDYSFLSNSIGFKSPKAQVFQKKVQDLHKGMDTFNARRPAKIKEYVRKFLQYIETVKHDNTEANAKSFEKWLNTVVKNDNFLVNVQIDKYYGTSLWLCHAAQRANYWKLYRAAVRVFAGLFHANGNCNYSVIEVYDEYVMKMLEKHNKSLHDHLITRFFTNLTGELYCAQSHDARHEEVNKRGQNMFPGNSLEELDLAFRIVDDVWDLREKAFLDMGISQNSHNNVVIPDLEPLIVKMRTAIRKNGLLENPLDVTSLKSFGGDNLDSSLKNVFESSENRRKNDILNVMRYNSFNSAFDIKKGRIAVFKDDKMNKTTVEEISNQILILIYCIEDDNTQKTMRDIFEKKEKKEESLTKFMENLIDKNYQDIL